MDYFESLLTEVPSFVPEAEYQGAFELANLLRNLGSYKSRFENAVALFEETATRTSLTILPPRGDGPLAEFFKSMELQMAERNKYAEWQRIAARDCTMTVFHFSKTLAAIDGYWPKAVPSMKGNIDFASKKEGEKEFGEAFPFANDLRHAVAHHGEFQTPKGVAEHRITGGMQAWGISVGESSAVYMTESISGTMFGSSFEGKVVHLAIETATAETLGTVRDKFVHAFTNFLPDEAKERARWISRTDGE